MSERLAVTPLTATARRILVVSSGFALIAGVQLFVGSEHTDRFFAWTIQPFLTSAFLGACYLSAIALLFLASREGSFAEARVSIISGLVLVTLLLVVTLIHLERFHLHSSSVITRLGTWAFIGAYIVLPPALLLVVVQGLRLGGGDPPRTLPLPAWARLTLVVHAAVLLSVGAALAIAPSTADALWPWALTPLTARAVAAWLLSIGVAAGLGAWENDWRRIRVPLVVYAILAALQFVALGRYGSDPGWSGVASWLYVLFLASMLGLGVYGAYAVRRLGHTAVVAGA